MFTPRTPLRRLLKSIRPVSLVALVAAVAGSAAAQTLPTGGTVAQGTASIGAASGGQMTVSQTSSRAVINWTGFSIGSGGQVTFNQPSASSAILNRVTGSQASQLAGSLSANGQVFLVNPNGVEISGTGSVDASGGFLASSLDVSDADFMNGTLSFSGASTAGSVVNQGSIVSGGFAVLLGTSVSNSGTITVPLGRVGMGAATSATVDLTGDGFLQVVLPADATDAAGTPLVDNSGTITANGGLVMLKASVAANAVRQAVNLSGSIQAQTVSGTSGSIVLSANGGGSVTVASSASLDASDATGQSGGTISLTAGGAMVLSGSVNASGTNAGGRVDVTGDAVTLTGATVDATGVNAGGLIRIGGAYKGGAADDGSDAYGYFVTRWGTLPSLANASTVSIDAASSLHADGTAMPVWPDTNLSEFGTGGTIIVFSSQDTSLNTADWRAGGLNGAIAVSSLGTISNLVFPVHRTQQEFAGDCSTNTQCNSNPMTYFGPDAAEYLFFGAKDLLIAHTGYDSGGVPFINADGLQSTVENAREVSIEASNDLTLVGGFSPQDGGDLQASSPRPSDYLTGTLRDLTFAAGRTLTMNGDIDGSSADLFLYANDPAANGASGLRDSGIANLDLSNSTLDQSPLIYAPHAQEPIDDIDRSITITLMAGNDSAAGSRIFLPVIDGSPQGGEANAWDDFDNLTISALGQGSIEFNGDVSGNIDAHFGGAPPIGSITLTGNLIFAADTTIAATNVTWTDQGTATLSGDARGQSGFSANYEFDTVDDNSIHTSILSGTVYDTSAILPTVGSVVLGTATIDDSVAGALTIDQTSDRSVLDWQSFSLGSAAVVTFNQPSATSATLNRVETGAPFSEIDGTIHSNGQVYLINENGITIGATGLIDTRGGFIGSTIDIGNSNFLNDVLQFSGDGGGSVSNAGTISTDSGGLVGLFGASVANSGSITTPGGQIALGAAQAFTLTPSGDALLTLNDVSALATSGGTLIDQTGILSALGGRIEARTASPNGSLGQTVEFGGTITATDSVFATDAVALEADGAGATVDGTVTVDSTTGATGGAIELSAGRQLTLTGSLSAQGDTGGRIDVTAGTLTVTGAAINASGATAGGLIRLGGAYRAGTDDDGSPAYAFYAGSFGALPSLATAGTVSVDSSTAVMATGGTGGVLIVDSLTNTAMNAIWNVSSSGGADISSLGTLSALPDFGSLHLDTTGVLTLGAQTIDLSTTPSGTAGVSSIDLGALMAAIPSLNTLYVEASDTLTIAGGLSLPGTLVDSEFHAGRGITVTGTLNGGGGQLGLYANDPFANGARLSDRGSGAAFIDLTGADLVNYSSTQPGDISLWLEAGNDNAAGGQIRLSPMDGSVLTGSGVASFADLAIETDGGGEILFDGNMTTTAGGGTNKNPQSTLTLTGNLAFAADTTITSANLTWIGASTATVSGVGNGTPDFVANVAMIDNGVVQYRGKLDDGQAAQIAVDGLAAFRDTQAVYGADAADFANAAFRLINGSLATGDTLGSDLSPGLVTITTGGVSRFNVGTQGVTETLDTSASSANDKPGYFFWLAAPASNAVDIIPRPITYTGIDATSTYGTLATVSGSLTGVLSGDTVDPLATLSQNGVAATLGARLSAGSYQIDVTSLTGAEASDYVLATTGNQSGTLTIYPKTVTYNGGNITGTYGTLATLDNALSGVLSGDDVTAALGVKTGSGTSITYTSRTNTGAYTIDDASLSGAQASDYVIDPSVTGTLTIDPKSVTYNGGNVTGTYGTLATLDNALSACSRATTSLPRSASKTARAR